MELMTSCRYCRFCGDRKGEGEDPVVDVRRWALGKDKFDAKRFAKFGKFIKEEGNVSIEECFKGVINDGGNVGFWEPGVLSLGC
jgi:hypothetical protein